MDLNALLFRESAWLYRAKRSVGLGDRTDQQRIAPYYGRLIVEDTGLPRPRGLQRSVGL